MPSRGILGRQGGSRPTLLLAADRRSVGRREQNDSRPASWPWRVHPCSGSVDPSNSKLVFHALRSSRLATERTIRQAVEVVMIQGGCFCGAVRYEVGGTATHETNCHCSICRRTTGAPFVSWASFPKSEFRFTQGKPTAFASSETGTRHFCPGCGCQLVFVYGSEPLVDISLGSLDDPTQITPKDNTQTSSQLPWIKLADALPSFSEGRPDE